VLTPTSNLPFSASSPQQSSDLSFQPGAHHPLAITAFMQVLARRVRKLGEALRKAVVGEVEALEAGEMEPPLAGEPSWEHLVTGGCSDTGSWATQRLC